MKYKFLFILSALLITTNLSFATTKNETAILNKQVNITYSGNSIDFYDVTGTKVYPITYNNSTYLPVRALSALFNVEIQWDNENRTIDLGKGEISSNCAKKNNNLKQSQF